MTRARFTWEVELADEQTSERVQVQLSAFWSPEKVQAGDVAAAAAAEASQRQRPRRFIPLAPAKLKRRETIGERRRPAVPAIG